MIATAIVAITLIGIVGISIGKYSGQNLMGPGIILDGVASIESGLNKGFTFLQSNFKNLINYNSNLKETQNLKKENEEL